MRRTIELWIVESNGMRARTSRRQGDATVQDVMDDLRFAQETASRYVNRLVDAASPKVEPPKPGLQEQGGAVDA